MTRPPGRPPRGTPRVRVTRLSITLTETERAALQLLADADAVSLSAFVVGEATRALARQLSELVEAGASLGVRERAGVLLDRLSAERRG